MTDRDYDGRGDGGRDDDTILSESLLKEDKLLVDDLQSTGYWGSVMTMFKAIVGMGILALPSSFRSTGFVLGIVLLLVMSLVSLYTMRIIILSVHEARKMDQSTTTGQIEYSDLTVVLGKWASIVAIICIILCQVGACCGYIAFIASNISNLNFARSFDHVYIALIATAMVGTLCMFRTLGFVISVSSLLGNLALIVAVLCIFYFGMSENDWPSNKGLEIAVWTGIPTAFGTLIFTFSAHTEVVYVEQAMRDKTKFIRVLDVCFIFITTLYALFAGFSYSFWGPCTGMDGPDDNHNCASLPNGHLSCRTDTGSVFTNLSNGNDVQQIVLDCVVMGISLAMMMQYPITLFPATVTIESALNIFDDKRDSIRLFNRIPVPLWLARFIVRLVLVSFTFVLAVTLKSFVTILSLVGALPNGILAMIFPPLFYRYYCKLSLRQSILNWTVFAFGVLGSLFTTVWLILQYFNVSLLTNPCNMVS